MSFTRDNLSKIYLKTKSYSYLKSKDLTKNSIRENKLKTIDWAQIMSKLPL